MPHSTCYNPPMVRTGDSEPRQHATRHLVRANAGETVKGTDRGRLIVPAAQPFQLPRPLAPKPGAPDTLTALDELRAEGS